MAIVYLRGKAYPSQLYLLKYKGFKMTRHSIENCINLIVSAQNHQNNFQRFSNLTVALQQLFLPNQFERVIIIRK